MISLTLPKSPILKAANLRARKSAIRPLELPAEGDGNLGKEEQVKFPEELKNQALQNISRCYKYALGAGFLGAASLMFDNRATLFQQGGIGSIPLRTVVDFSVHGHQVIFGLGLCQALQIFQQGTKGGTRLDADRVDRVGKVLSRVWGMAACMLSVEALALAFSFEPLWIRSLTWVLLMANIPISRGFHSDVSFSSQKQTPAKPEYLAGRTSGFNAARNMIFCVAALVISGVIDLVETVINMLAAKGVESKVGSLISGMMNTAESVAMVGLLFTLYRQFIRATVTATQEQTAKNESFVGYFEAQSKFYTKVGKFFASQIFFTILRYVVTGVKVLLIYAGLQQYAKFL
jgi:hypothetical protein